MLEAAIHGHFATDTIFKLKTLSRCIRCVCHIEVFRMKFAGGLGNYLVTLSAKFRGDRM